MKSAQGVCRLRVAEVQDGDIIFDSNTNFGTTAEKAYFLNTNYLYLIQHPRRSGPRTTRRSRPTRTRS
jgi:hypothetical protein